jgi:thiamine-monophosphate kinase
MGANLFRNETQFVKWLRARAGAGPADVRVGIGDDAALVRPRRGFELILKADMSLEGVHFDARLHPATSVGHRALARPLSDVAAMGGTPRFALISLAFSRSRQLTSRWIEDFYRGLAHLARRYRVAIIGGDTAITSSQTFADVVVVGEIPSGAALLRSGARPSDEIFVSGRLGMSRLGLEALRWKQTAKRRAGRAGPPPGWQAGELSRAIEVHLFPEPRVALGQFLVKNGLASAAIDVSDGLSTDLAHLAEASHVGARIWASLLPAPQTAVGGAAEALRLALNGGEDYELLFTVPARLAARVPSAYRGVPLHRIGEIRPSADGLTLIREDGAEVPLEPGGFDHFSNPPKGKG